MVRRRPTRGQHSPTPETRSSCCPQPAVSYGSAIGCMLRRMRQIWITKAGSPEVLVVKEAPDPEAKKGEVRVRVRASGVNFADLLARVGLYPDAPKIPCVVGYEVSGTIDQVGEGVTGFAVGDRVFGMPRFGGYTDVIALAAEQVFKLPSSM